MPRARQVLSQLVEQGGEEQLSLGSEGQALGLLSFEEQQSSLEAA